jgi:NAD(P)-dependent dehydrogenase (short-subunit alcohol dehydrogenase family)
MAPGGAVHPDTVVAGAATRPLGGRHALVTGASRGIGAAIALELARLGADLTIVARSPEALDAFAPRLAAAGAREVNTIACDIVDLDALARMLAAAASALGTISILVNNAGGAQSAPFTRTDGAMWRAMFALNVDPVHAACRAVLPAMTGEGWGRIVNIASTAGLKGYAYISAYVAAKHAVVGLTRALAIEVARSGVTVNAVCPGYTDTPMIDAAIRDITQKTGRAANETRASLAATSPLNRLVRPEEVAACVGWLCRNDAAAVTGPAIAIAGGEI